MAYRNEGPSRDRQFVAQCRVGELEGYAVDVVRAEPKKLNENWDKVRVHHTVDGGNSWVEVPMKRSLLAALRVFAYSGDWPPPNVIDLHWRDGSLHLSYCDEWIQDNEHHYQWIAVYRPGRKHWTVEKVGKIRHDEPQPSMLEDPQPYRWQSPRQGD